MKEPEKRIKRGSDGRNKEESDKGGEESEGQNLRGGKRKDIFGED